MPTAAPIGPVASAHPLMGPMYWACAEVLATAADLGTTGSLPAARELRGTLEQQLSTMMGRARAAGIAVEDALDAQYALVALVDEQLARARGWQGHAEWRTMPLQLVRFNENTAGESFFRRLAVLEGQPHRAHVLQVYFLCLAVGFQGRYAINGGDGLAAVYDRVAARIAQASGPDLASPHGEPRDGRGFLRREAPLVRIGVAVFGAALVVFVALKVTLAWEIRESTHGMREYAATSSTRATAKR